ncbi:hypothetical protein J2S43_004102 [Catenuloplanes nepalensis]|uniref:Excalibur calcium-binding domain-containing protein n=1 Tax=Catenuloplanes nepalensis TaxID=587533 RepID=A0ABT9MVY1_9ACTN|nr:excalibur calcium-binding domain-containing protein [Catenuloplanes nepalensis]MDP9795590.1 hypothetical protein [Catenuloplanes nepalensis]
MLAAPALALLAAPAQAEAPKKPPVYKNCAAMNAAHPHGVARYGSIDKVRGKTKPVTKFKVMTAVYLANTHLDRDKDGVACEKR